jgi:hypothetical protein
MGNRPRSGAGQRGRRDAHTHSVAPRPSCWISSVRMGAKCSWKTCCGFAASPAAISARMALTGAEFVQIDSVAKERAAEYPPLWKG